VHGRAARFFVLGRRPRPVRLPERQVQLLELDFAVAAFARDRVSDVLDVANHLQRRMEMEMVNGKVEKVGVE